MTTIHPTTTSPSRPPGPSVSCVFVCHDKDGRILMARRGSGARDEPGTWDTGAGGIEFGETFEEAVTREVREEYATEALSVETIGVRNVLRESPPSHWVAVIFAVELDPTTVTLGEPHKFDQLGWFAPEDLPGPLHSQTKHGLAIFQEWQARH